MVLQAGVGFEDAANELVRDLTDQELNSIITEVESRYGKEISTSGFRPAGTDDGTDLIDPGIDLQ
jgi:hypothetical protein